MKKFLPKSVNNPSGFTLVELLVVISIIAILSVIGVTLFGTVQKNARDSRRKGDIESISKALEANYTSGSSTPYPVLTDLMFASGKIPTDPQTAATYTGTPTAVGASYMVCATLEGTSGNASSNTGTGIGASSGGFFCRKNAQ